MEARDPPAERARRRAPVVAAALLVVLVFVITSWPTASVAPTPSTPSAAPEPIVRVAPAFLPSGGVHALGATPAEAPIRVVVGLAPPDPAAMSAMLALLSTPGTPEYGHYLTAAQVADLYAPSASDYAKAVHYFSAQGLAVTTSPDRWAITVSGTAARVGPAFGTQFETYLGPSGRFYDHPTAAVLPAIVPWSGVLGLGSESVMRPLVGPIAPTAARVSPAASCSTSMPYAPCVIDAAYGISSLLTAGYNGTGTTVGVVDVYDGTEPQSQLVSDVASFTTTYSLPHGTIHYLYPVPTSTNLNTTSTGWGSEEVLDLEWSRATAPGATIDMTFAPDPTTGLYSSVDWLVAHQAVNVISLSWGEPDVGVYNAYAGACTSACNASSDGSYTILHPVMTAAALEGISVFAASGDCGAAFGTNGVATSYPASDPWVTGVGATNLVVGSGGSYSSETAWSGNDSGVHNPGCQNQGGSGGGYSPFVRPTWQSAPGYPSAVNVRGVPDISIIGGTPVAVVQYGYGGGAAGTSVSCPIWAGLAAIADQIRGAPLGFLDPALYRLARASNASSYFRDITSGSNGYRTTTGWDPVTGIGTPKANTLLPALTATNLTLSPLFSDVRASPRSGSAPLAVEFSSLTYGATSSVFTYDVDFGDGNATWSPSGFANHTFAKAGVYLARTVAFLNDGNSSVSPPVSIVVGGGALTVNLTASTTTPAAGVPTTLIANVTGGTSPYRYSYSFGDGTYLSKSSQSSVSHAYAVAGTYCAVVVASDAAAPANGGSSSRLAIAVGGSTGGSCHGETSLLANISASVLTTDLPGDIAFHVSASGGTPPYSIRLVSDDPYVTACDCGIFSQPGLHVVDAFVNDSQSGSTRVSMNVTLLPMLRATFSASPTIGNGSLNVTFTSVAYGGDGPDANLTNWTFGDGPTSRATGAHPTHLYAAPGFYVADARLTDAAGWNATGAVLIDVRPSSTPTALAVSASVLPGSGSTSGPPLRFLAHASGGTAPYSYHWDLGPGRSAYGVGPQESYPTGFCPSAPSCVFDVYLNVTDAAGTSVSAAIPLDLSGGANGSALELMDSVTATSGVTPFTLWANSSTPGPFGMTQVIWNFDDGNESVLLNASHQYLTPGNYTLTDTATDLLGDSIVHARAVHVSGLARTLPLITGGPYVRVGIAPFSVNFTVYVTGGAGAPYTYAWNFGDGTIGTGPDPTHVYTTAGNYTPSLVASDAIGTPASSTWTLIVYNESYVILTAIGPTGPVGPGTPFNVLLTASAVCTGRSWPGCPGGLSQLVITPEVGSTFGTTFVTLNATGVAIDPLSAPILPGMYLYTVQTQDFGYSGQTNFTINVSAGVIVLPPPNTASSGLPIALVAAGIGVTVLGAGTLVLAYRRRRPPPTPTP